MEKITVCQVLAGDEEGGLEKHVVELSNCLVENYHVVVIAHEKYRGRFDKKISFMGLNLAKGRRNPVALISLYMAIKKYHPDIIHAQANKAAHMVATVKPFLPGKFVATVHSIKTNMKMYRHFDHVIAVSNLIAGRVGNVNVDVIFNGIAPAKAGAVNATSVFEGLFDNNELSIVAAIGRLVDVKGFDVLIGAWKSIEANLAIVGDGPLHGKLLQQIKDTGAEDRVCLMGHRDDIPEILKGVDLVVISSRREGFPYVMIEALHARKVVISSKVSGAMDILPEACLFEVNDPESLAACVNNVLSNKELVINQFRPIWDMAMNELTVDGMTKKTSDVYRRLVCS
jgi:glycosyltransferase involved in cell wall biosynthesis